MPHTQVDIDKFQEGNGKIYILTRNGRLEKAYKYQILQNLWFRISVNSVCLSLILNLSKLIPLRSKADLCEV